MQYLLAFFTWSLYLIITNKYDDVIFLSLHWKSKKVGEEKRQMEEEKKKECTGKKAAFHLLYVLSSYL